MTQQHPHLFTLAIAIAACSTSTQNSADDDDGSAGGSSQGGQAPAPKPSFTCPAEADAVFDTMAGAFASQLDGQGVPGGAVAMVCGGEVRRVFAHGVAQAGGAPVTPDTRFQWASTTKMFTAAAAIAMVEDGILDLHTPVAELVPYLTYPGVTLHHLLTHTAGYPTEFVSYSSDLPTVGQTNGSIPMWANPGEVHLYSNPGFAIAGLVLEHVVGQPYAQLVQDRVFARAGMGATFDVAVVMSGDHAVGHDDYGPVAPNGSYLHTGTYGPMGGAWGSVKDLARWGQVHLDPDGVLTTESVEALRSGYTRTGIPATDYGYGLFVQHSTPRVVHHGGSTVGYLADWQLLPDQGFGVFMLVNADWFIPSSLADDAIEALYAPTFDGVPPAGGIDDYLGSYHDPHELGTIEVRLEAGQLIAHFAATGIDAVLDYAYGDVYYASYAPTGGFIDALFWRPDGGGPATHLVSLWGVAARTGP
jgi:CubicO group peptidase (beta-lactamase class C family)